MQLKISQRSVGEVNILELVGRIVFGEESSALRNIVRDLLNERKNKILIDMSGVTYIDSGGNGTLASAWSTVRSQTGALRFFHPSEKFYELLQVTKLSAVYEVFDDEATAIKSFQVKRVRCHCPTCGGLAQPGLHDELRWPPQNCETCNSQFTVYSRADHRGQAHVTSIRIWTYANEYFHLTPGSPFIIQVVGRLDLFSSSRLTRVWQSLPLSPRVVFDLSETSEVDNAGANAIIDLAANCKHASGVLSIEGCSAEVTRMFPLGVPVCRDRVLVRKALEGGSSISTWLVTTKAFEM